MVRKRDTLGQHMMYMLLIGLLQIDAIDILTGLRPEIRYGLNGKMKIGVLPQKEIQLMEFFLGSLMRKFPCN